MLGIEIANILRHYIREKNNVMKRTEELGAGSGELLKLKDLNIFIYVDVVSA